MNQPRLAIVGGGNMGFALAKSYHESYPDATIVVADPVQAQLDKYLETPIETTLSNKDAVHRSEMVILAVKPQVMREVVEEIEGVLTHQLVVSIAAGTPLNNLEKWIDREIPIVRCMPNTPVLVGKGMFGFYGNMQVTPAHRAMVESTFSPTGSALWFKSDREIDAVTALSGSGPAYFFYLTEAMVEAGLELGLDQDQARELAVQTSLGRRSYVARAKR